MERAPEAQHRRTSVDVVFDHLHDEIVSLRLLPGDKISEADIAARFGVSRQPVRDAFSRLANLDLLLIRPQKATEVRRFSSLAIAKSRFVRAAIEAEVLRRAASACTDTEAALLDNNLVRQEEAVAEEDQEKFSALDYQFHRTLCEIAGVPFAFEVISSEKAKVDRLCVLSLSETNRMPQLLRDHQAIAKGVKDRDVDAAVAAGMLHLSRLDATIETISKMNADYFDQ